MRSLLPAEQLWQPSWRMQSSIHHGNYLARVTRRITCVKTVASRSCQLQTGAVHAAHLIVAVLGLADTATARSCHLMTNHHTHTRLCSLLPAVAHQEASSHHKALPHKLPLSAWVASVPVAVSTAYAGLSYLQQQLTKDHRIHASIMLNLAM